MSLSLLVAAAAVITLPCLYLTFSNRLKETR